MEMRGETVADVSGIWCDVKFGKKVVERDGLRRRKNYQGGLGG